MKVSYNWLKSYLPISNNIEEVSTLLTSIGLEVEDVHVFETIEGGLKNVVIGEVLSCEKHPDADKLKVTTVNIGTAEPLQIVCGAPNVAAGQKVVVALEGASLLPLGATEKFQIKKAKIRGVESRGMICSEKELGLRDVHEGILVLPQHAAPGTPAAEYFNIETDYVFEIGLTPNRSDAFSHIGVARDLKTVLNVRHQQQLTLQMPSTNTWQNSGEPNPIAIEIQNTTACPRYSGISIAGITVKESPDWLKNKLKAIGIRSINNVVDITNFVLHEYGQPLHVFDADTIKGNKVIVRNASEGEKFVTLDGTERTLKGFELMICNAEEPMCIAGVFGGAKSGVTATTQNIFIESAYFTPSGIRKTSYGHNLRTDAAMHYEKGTDPSITITALQRAVSLILELAGGKVVGAIADVYPTKIEPTSVTIQFDYIRKLSGFHIEQSTIVTILQELGIEVSASTQTGLLLSVPTFKPDVTRPADIVEEILRIYGYNNFELPTKLNTSISFSSEKNETKLEQTLAHLLTGLGFSEVTTNSVSQSAFEQDTQLQQQQVKLLNSQTSELDCLRTSMLYGMLESVAHNQNRKAFDIAFFEFGKTYHKTEKGYKEYKHLALLLSGNWQSPNWITPTEKADFFHLKQALEGILQKLGIENTTFAIGNNAALQNAFAIQKTGKEICFGGEVSHTVKQRFGIKGNVLFACLDFNKLLTESAQAKITFKPLPKYPSVKRDLALVVEKDVTFSAIETLAKKESKNLLTEISLFDVYEGEKIEAGKKSCAVSFVFQHSEKTLTDEEVEKTMSRLVTSFERELGAGIRK
ncbi:MAG: phenylalanine--tRNA ligase subunit beta [Chitinophagales bacterium]|nr:phenylalanine--tRNA ligase subunit beta [Chitinophagales bacterium]